MDTEQFILWYEENKRNLPWRNTDDPYRIWLSEAMLQQTRVETVKEYYAKFLEKLPNIQALAECDEEELMKLWEGLGYYNRARNLQKAAQEIVARFEGVMPTTYEELITLPGIGDYTANAICAFAYNQDKIPTDGNILRVAARYFNDFSDISLLETKKKLAEGLAYYHKEGQGRLYASALMELGATLCGPNKNPECDLCPLRADCKAKEHGTATDLPVKKPKNQRKIQRLTVFICRDGENILLHKRENKGLLAGLYEFPHASGWGSETAVRQWLKKHGLNIEKLTELPENKHIFTHIEWQMKVYDVTFSRKSTPDPDWLVVPIDYFMERYPLPTAFRKLLKTNNKT